MGEQPVLLRYEGDGEFGPVSGYWASQCDRHFVVGDQYRMTEFYERSAASHSHFFAALNDAFGSLPDQMREEYPTVEHLRKKALIRKGYADERSIVCATKAEAQRLAAFMKPMDDYAIIVPSEAVVKVWTAKSQSKKAMGAKAFQESKQAVLDFVDDLLGVQRGETARAAGYQIEHEPSAPPADEGSGVAVSPSTDHVAAPLSGDEPGPEDGTTAPETAVETGHGGQPVPSSNVLSNADRAWLMSVAKQLWPLAAPGYQDDVNRIAKDLKANVPADIGELARKKATSVVAKVKEVCFGEKEAEVVKVDIAAMIGAEAKEIA